MSLGKRIGIGTTQPESFLHVISDAGATIPTMIIQGEQPGLEMRLENGNVVSSLLTDENDQLVLTNTMGGVVFRTGATADPVLTLREDGNVEITGTIFQNGEEFVGGGGGDSLPIGSFFKYPWPTDPTDIPAGYLKCDGSLISRTDFADLFSVIGVLYGEGDGSTTFAVPTFSNHIIKFSSTTPAETIDFLPVGSTLLIPWTIDPYPKGYLKCDGREVSREVYSLLFANVGTEFGVGDGSTTFNLPILSNHGIKFQTTIKGDLDDIVPWVPSDQVGDIYYPGNVGIGVSNPQARLHVEGNILVKGNVVPAENETYDLGSSTSAFRDLYLSGDTIFLGNTKITSDPVTGSVTFLDKDSNEVKEIVSENTQNISVQDGNTIIASGNVGIGTTNPAAKLHVVGEGRFGVINLWETDYKPDGQPWYGFLRESTNIVRYNAFAGHAFSTSGGQAMIINSSGDVGIGITNPQAKLDINGNVTINGIMRLNRNFSFQTRIRSNFNHRIIIPITKSNVFAQILCSVKLAGTANNGSGETFSITEAMLRIYDSNQSANVIRQVGSRILIQYVAFSDSTGQVEIEVHPRLGFEDVTSWTVSVEFINPSTVIMTYGTPSFMDLGVNQALAAPTLLSTSVERNTILGGGNVGIGTTNPESSLSVVGPLNALTQQVGVHMGVFTGAGGGFAGMEIVSSHENGGWIDFKRNIGNSDYHGRIRYASSGEFAGMGFYTGDGVSVPGTERMRITTAGNVGIGTTSPSEKLVVDDGSDPQAITMQKNGNFASQNQALLFRAKASDRITGAIHKRAEDLRVISRGSVSRILFYTGANENSGFDTEVAGNPFAGTYTNTDDVPKMTIANNGNVGIGANNPQSLLSVGGNGNSQWRASIINTNVGVFISRNDNFGMAITTTSTASNIYVLDALRGSSDNTGAGGSSAFRVNADGNVGIGITNPTERLQVQGNILATGTITPSDIRIKTDIEEIQDGQALSKLRLIEPHEYSYIDKETRGEHTVYGFLAQQVREHFPEATRLIQDYIPDVFKVCYVNLEENIIVLGEGARNGRLKIQIGNQVLELQVTKINDVIVTYNPEDLQEGQEMQEEVFVYGYQVDDFHILNKDYLFTINFAATQELDRTVQTQNLEITTQKQQLETQRLEIEDLKTVNDDLMMQNMSLKNRVSELESQLSSLLTALTDKGIL